MIWDVPAVAADGDSAFMYAIYKFDSPSIQQSDLENSSNLKNVVSTKYSDLSEDDDLTAASYFTITALDRNFNESSISGVIPVKVEIPAKPLLYFPVDLAENQKDTIQFVWEDTPHSSFNRLQISADINFTNLLVNQSSITDTFKTASGFSGLTTYYWRLTASNAAGESEFSDIRSFRTGFPLTPVLLQPLNLDTVETLSPQLSWASSEAAQTYRLKVAEGWLITPDQLVIDTTITDTIFPLPELKENKLYTWSVGAENEYGFSGLANVSKFRTHSVTLVADKEGTLPDSYSLYQNYPNPFNPTTKISFTIPQNSYTVIRVYNVLGQQVKELLNDNLSAGRYSIEFNADSLPSGMYIYIMESGSHLFSKKMMLLK